MPVDQAIERKAAPEPQASSSTELSIEGMTCGNCARHVTEALQSVPGVHSAMVNLDSRGALVRWSPAGARNPVALVAAVQEAGYQAKLIDANAPVTDVGLRKLAGWQLTLWIGVVGTLPLMVGEWGLGLGTTPWFRWFSF